MSMTTVKITVDKAPNLAAAEQRAYEIADQFYAVGEGVRDYHLDQTDAYPEQQIVTTAAGADIPVGAVTFYVEFVARWLS